MFIHSLANDSSPHCIFMRACIRYAFVRSFIHSLPRLVISLFAHLFMRVSYFRSFVHLLTLTMSSMQRLHITALGIHEFCKNDSYVLLEIAISYGTMPSHLQLCRHLLVALNTNSCSPEGFENRRGTRQLFVFAHLAFIQCLWIE